MYTKRNHTTETLQFTAVFKLKLNTIEVDPTVVNGIATVISNNQQITDFSLPSCFLSNDMIRCIFDDIKMLNH